MDAEFVVMLVQLWAGRKNGRDTRAEGVSFPAVVDSRTVPCQIRSECIKRPPYWDRPVLLHEVSDNAISVWIWVDVEPDARQSLQGKRETETDYSDADELISRHSIRRDGGRVGSRNENADARRQQSQR